MIDLNDHQLDEHGKQVSLLTNKKFKDRIEKKHFTIGCPGLKNAKYIIRLEFYLNIPVLADKTWVFSGYNINPIIATSITNPYENKYKPTEEMTKLINIP